VHGGAAAVASGHLALDPRGCHPCLTRDRRSTSRTGGNDLSRHGRRGGDRTSELAPPSPTTRESGRRPLGDRTGDGRRPPGESPDHLGKTWGNQLIADTQRSAGNGST
jgi:hypothetical protein